jgi:hypothetical protein
MTPRSCYSRFSTGALVCLLDHACGASAVHRGIREELCRRWALAAKTKPGEQPLLFTDAEWSKTIAVASGKPRGKLEPTSNSRCAFNSRCASSSSCAAARALKRRPISFFVWAGTTLEVKNVPIRILYKYGGHPFPKIWNARSSNPRGDRRAATRASGRG